MAAKALLSVIAALGITACTTVDMTAMGSGSGVNVLQSSEPNVIEKATSRLFALFSSKGWSTHDSRKKMRSAANVLLNGLDQKTLDREPSPYVTMVADRATLAADMREARIHIDQTVKAAEVYLSMAGPDEDIRDELADLEQALLAARQAEKVFAAAGARVGSVEEANTLAPTVDRLRDITDEFGRRVRRAQNRSVAVVAGGELNL